MADAGAGAGTGDGEGEGAGEGAGEGEGAGAGGGAGAGAGGAEGAEGAGEGAGGEGGDPWFETIELSDEERAYLVNNSYHKHDGPEQALQLALRDGMAAQKKLGAPADQLMRRPEKDQDLSEWRKANAKTLGVPETPDAYGEGFKLPEAPEGLKWGEGIHWDKAREAETYKAFHDMGVPTDLAHGVMGLYAKSMLAEAQQIRTEAATLQQQLNDKLTAEYGGEAQGRLNRAARAMHTIFEKAGVPAESAGLLQQKMMREGKIADAQLVKVFDRIAEMMGEDSLTDDILRGGGAGPGGVATPSEAQARLDQIKARGTGDWAKAVAAGDEKRKTALRKEMHALNGVLSASAEKRRAG